MQRASFSIVFLLLTVMCFPQGFSTKVYSAEDGLLDNWPTGIAQDGNGNLWIRHSRGFTKFDGIMFTAYYDKKTDSHQYWDRNNYVTNENGIVYTAGLDLKHFPGSVQNVKLDSFLVYQDRRYEKKSRTKNLIDRNGYRIFTATRGGQNNLNKVYFQFNSKLDSLPGPLSSCKHISKIKCDGEVITTQDAEEIYKDNLGSVYIRFCDTVQLTNTFYLFDKGRLHKILTSGNFGSDVRIVTTLNGLRWIIGNTNKTLYAECLNDRGKTVKVIVKPGFFHQDNMRDVSKAVADSKNNIWFSWGQTGLVKLGMQGVEIFRDEGRDVPKVSQLYYDVNGRESFQYVEEYSNFYLGFAIDHYDNIICGDRLFDGKQFSALSVETAFTSLFRTTNGTAITSINDCFVDRENNVWLAITHGLIKLSPTPFKKIDTRLSSAEADYEMDQTDSHGRKYYKKTDPQTKTILLKVIKSQNVIYEKKFNTDNVELEIQPLGEKVLFKYWDNKGNAVLELTDLSKQYEVLKIKSDQSSFRTLINRDNKEILFYYYQPFSVSNTLVYVDGNRIRKITVNDTIARRLNERNNYSLRNISGSLDLIITDDLTAYELTKDLQLKPADLKSCLHLDSKPKNFLFYKERAGNTSFYLDDNGKFLKIKGNKVKELCILNWDTLSKQADLNQLYIATRGVDIPELAILKDLLVFVSKDHMFVFNMNSADKVIFLHKIDFSRTEGFTNFTPQGIYTEGEFLAMQGETDVRIVSYNELFANSLNNNKTYRIHPGFSQKISRNESGETMIGQIVSYLGRRGFNTTPPLLSNFELAYKQDGEICVKTLKSGEGLNMDYSNSKMFIDYKAVCLTDGSKVRYKYKLEGYDPDWIIATKPGTEYSSLPAGSYTFKVYACNNEQLFTATFSSFNITVIPPWYKRNWAFVLYITGGIGLMYLIVKLNSRRLVAKAKELEIKIAQATAEIKEQKEAVEEKNKEIEEKQREIIDSIRYARRIQTSLLAPEKYIHRVLNKLNRKKN